MKRSLATLFLCLLSVTAYGQLSETAAWTADLINNYRVVPNITYSVANNYECKLDVYARLPAPKVFLRNRQAGQNVSGPIPTVLHIHGGGWVAGTKEQSILNIAPYLEMGFNVVSVEYRLAKSSLAPAAVEDCRLALRWVFRNAKEYGFDTTKVVVTGGSAGGHLALMTGMLDASAGFDAPKDWDSYDTHPKVAAILNFFGITDVVDLLSGPNKQAYAVSWLGNQPDRETIARRVSPLTYVRKGLPPILTIHGDNDQLVPYSHATRLHDALAKAGVQNQLLTIPEGRHGGFSREEMIRIYSSIKEFLKKNGITN